jgi:hypothetical protein
MRMDEGGGSKQWRRRIGSFLSRNEVNQRTGTDRRDTEIGFRTLVGDILRDPRRTLISVTLPGGEVLDEVAVKALVGS